jgi:hypothetical protein
MDRRNFFRGMIGGVAAAAAVRIWPFRVYSFPAELPKILNPIVGQTVWTTGAAGQNYFRVGDIVNLEGLALEHIDLNRFRVTAVDMEERTINVEYAPRNLLQWAAVDPACEVDSESARTINKLMEMGLLR